MQGYYHLHKQWKDKALKLKKWDVFERKTMQYRLEVKIERPSKNSVSETYLTRLSPKETNRTERINLDQNKVLKAH